MDPTIQHYKCMVVHLGHYGRLEEAYNLIMQLRVQPDFGIRGCFAEFMQNSLQCGVG